VRGGVFPATGLHFKTVSRDDLMRSHPSSMLEVFPHCVEALDTLDKFLGLKLQTIAGQGFEGPAAAGNPKRLRNQAYSRQNMLELARDSAGASWHC
jgi:hypothetical protein